MNPLDNPLVKGRGFTTEAQAQSYIDYASSGYKKPQDRAALAASDLASQSAIGSYYNYKTDTWTPATIKPDDLTGNKRAFSVPSAQTPTAGASIDAYSELQIESKKALDEAQAAQSTGESEFNATLNQIMDIPSQRSALEQQAGIAEKQASYDEYTSQLESEQRTLKKQQDAIYSNPMLTREQAQQQFGEIQRLSLSKQADIATLQSISSRDLTRAQDLIDKKIQNILEPLQMKYDFQKMFYQENREDLTKAQDRLFQVALAETENAITQSKATLDTIKDLFNTAAQNGAPQDVLNSILKAQTAGDLATAQRLAGGYLVNPLDQQLKQAQIASANRANQPSDSAPTVKSINGVDMQWNPSTGKWEMIKGDPTSNALGDAIAGAKVDNINNILSSKSLDSVVGPSGLARTNPGLWSATKRFFSGALAGTFAGGAIGAIPGAIIGGLTTGVVSSLRGTKDELTGDRQNFIASVEQMRSELTVEKLAQAKGQGVTFGALSDGERGLIANAATKIGSWAIHEGGNPDGTVIGYNIDEKSFKEEIDKINYFVKLDALIKGATLESVGAVKNPDGTVWIMNSDGTFTQVIRQ